MSEESNSPTGNKPPTMPNVVKEPNRSQLRQMIAPIKSPALQIGETIIHALQQDNTVAVITTVVVGPDGRQSVVTAALDPRMMSSVQQLLAQAEQEREDEEPCMGFHCLVKPKNSEDDDGDDGKDDNIDAGKDNPESSEQK